MLKEDGVSTDCGVENSHVEDPFEGHQREGDGEDRGAENLNDAGGVNGPEKEGQPEPRQPGARILWMVTTKLSPVRMEEKPAINTPSAAEITLVFEYVVLSGV